MNTLIRVRGWITDSHVINPQSSIYEPEKIHKLRLQPENPIAFKELEEAIEAVKVRSGTPANKSINRHKDVLIDGCEMIFKSFYKPKLYGALEDISSDGELLGKFVQTVGHIRIFKDMNIILTAHLIEPALLDDFDPLD